MPADAQARTYVIMSHCVRKTPPAELAQMDHPAPWMLRTDMAADFGSTPSQEIANRRTCSRSDFEG